MGLKTHAKTTLVVRQEGDAVRLYCHVGTGNYNPKTARMYEDLGVLSSRPELGADVTRFFNYITGFSQPPHYQELVTSPGGIRDRVVELIDAEAAAGPDGRIAIKVNGLDDVAVIDALYRASQAGVPIELVIRGICCLRPGVPGLSETIHVRSIVGRFLEHSRILRFGGAAGRPAVYYIGSADLRRRNLDRRVEAMIPVADPEAVARLEEILAVNLADDVQSWSLAATGRGTGSRRCSGTPPRRHWRRRRSSGATCWTGPGRPGPERRWPPAPAGDGAATATRRRTRTTERRPGSGGATRSSMAGSGSAPAGSPSLYSVGGVAAHPLDRLPGRHASPKRDLDTHYRGAWVGFDLLLVAAIVLTAYFAFRIDARVQLPATATATLLVVDAWFDVMTAGATAGRPSEAVADGRSASSCRPRSSRSGWPGGSTTTPTLLIGPRGAALRHGGGLARATRRLSRPLRSTATVRSAPSRRRSAAG